MLVELKIPVATQKSLSLGLILLNFVGITFIIYSKARTLNKFEKLLQNCVNGEIDKALQILEEHYEFLNQKDSSGWNCLINASKKGHSELVQSLLDLGATSTQSGIHTAIRGAALNGHVETVRVLLKNKVDVNVTSQDNKTALHGACMNGHKEIVELLLKAGANKEFRNNFGENAIDLARANGHDDIVQILLQEF